MNIDKSIEIITNLTHYSYTGNPQDELDALKLCIEALKLLRDHRDTIYFRYDLPLPGETRE